MKQVKIPKRYEDYMADYKKQVAELYKYMGAKSIGKLLGLSATTVLTWMRELDEDIRPAGPMGWVWNTDKIELIEESLPAIKWKESIEPLQVGQYVAIERELEPRYKVRAYQVSKKLGYKIKVMPMAMAKVGFLVQRIS